ncbi:MAG: L-lactate permease, partial [Firmicutes bacterium]|nr:L-lactate permease [Bacillota bacterium]
AGLGFPPVLAATVALLADTHPSSWGTQGMPLVILQSVTGLDITDLAGTVTRLTFLPSALAPAVLIWIVSGWCGLKGMWVPALASGLTYSLVAVATPHVLGPYVVGVTASVAATLVTLTVGRLLCPTRSLQLAEGLGCRAAADRAGRWAVEVLRAWSPYLLLVLVVGVANATPLKDWLVSVSTVTIPWPGLDGAVWKTPPVVELSTPYLAVYSQPILAVGGSLVFFAGLLAAPILGVRPAEMMGIYGRTVKQLLLPGTTIVSILGTAYLMNYSGMTFTMGLAFAQAGWLFPFVAALLGMLGCTVAGSVAASNALFGNLVVIAGAKVGIDPLLAAATLCAGGTMGKSITPQDLVIAAGSLGLHGSEGDLARRVIVPSLMLALLIGLAAAILSRLVT